MNIKRNKGLYVGTRRTACSLCSLNHNLYPVLPGTVRLDQFLDVVIALNLNNTSSFIIRLNRQINYSIRNKPIQKIIRTVVYQGVPWMIYACENAKKELKLRRKLNTRQDHSTLGIKRTLLNN